MLATSKMTTKGFRNKVSNSRANEPRRTAVGSLGPNLARRSRASAEDNPAGIAAVGGASSVRERHEACSWRLPPEAGAKWK